MNRRISEVGLRLIKNFEGCRLKAYKPVSTEKYWTIGWGHYGPDVKEGMTITQAQADAMLLNDLVRYEAPVNALSFAGQLNQNQFDALVSFCYNCGAGNLQKLCLGRTISDIPKNMILYNKGGGKVLAGLVRRRKAEVDLFLKEDDEMSAEVVKKLQDQIDKLTVQCQKQSEEIKALRERESMKVPAWAKDAVEAAVAKKLIDTPDGGSFDFYRFLATLHRNKQI